MGRTLPFTVNLRKGAPRSIEQNRLQRLWLKEAEDQGDMTAEEYRGYSKLHFGIVILHAEDEKFRATWNRLIRDRYSYEEKLELMQEPIDYPVTRLMTTKQKKRYLDAMYQHLLSLGFQLTEPRSRNVYH